MAWRSVYKLLRKSVFRRSQDDHDLDEEIQFHVAQETGRRVAGGMPRAEAERTARMALGSPALVKERTRAVWVWTAVEQFVQDMRFGFRILTKSPALSATAVLLVALVIGAATRPSSRWRTASWPSLRQACMPPAFRR